MSWLHMLNLAITALDRGDRLSAEEWSSNSLAVRPNWAAHRIEALLATDADAASESYFSAWNIGDAPPELAVEIATHFMTNGKPDALKRFIDALPPAVRDKERIVLARAVVAANDGQFDEVERLLMSRQFASIREGETLLSDLWVRLRRGRLEHKLQRAATRDEIRQDLASHPMPRELDLRMHVLEDTSA